MKRAVALILIVVCMVAGCAPTSQPDAFDEAAPRVYLENVVLPTENHGAYVDTYSFGGETSNRDMDLFNAIYESLSSTQWTTLEEGISRYTEFLDPGNAVTTPCTISGTHVLSDYSELDSSQLYVVKEFYLDLNLAAIEVRIRREPEEMFLLLFDIREDGFFAPLRMYFIQQGEDFEKTYQFVGTKDVRWMVAAFTESRGTNVWVRKIAFFNPDTNVIDIKIGSFVSLDFECIDPYLNWEFVARALDFDMIVQDDAVVKIDYRQEVKLFLYNGEVLSKKICTPIFYDRQLQQGYLATDEEQWFLAGDCFGGEIDLFYDELEALAKADEEYGLYLKCG